jgi:hypothetical protein
MICYIALYVDADGYLETEKLPEPLLTFYKEFRKGEMPVRQWTKELQEAVEDLRIPEADLTQDCNTAI